MEIFIILAGFILLVYRGVKKYAAVEEDLRTLVVPLLEKDLATPEEERRVFNYIRKAALGGRPIKEIEKEMAELFGDDWWGKVKSQGSKRANYGIHSPRYAAAAILLAKRGKRLFGFGKTSLTGVGVWSQAGRLAVLVEGILKRTNTNKL